MDQQVRRLVTVVKYLTDKKINLQGFDDRLHLQKMIYLAQVASIDLGFRFSWYRHGPYSPELTKTGFEYNENQSYYDEITPKCSLTGRGKERLQRTEDLIKANPGQEDSKWLELLASIHYLKWIRFDSVTRENVKEKLEMHGKRFEPNDIAAAWSALQDVGLIDSKTVRDQ